MGKVLLDLAQESWESRKSVEPPGSGRGVNSPELGEAVLLG